MALVLKKIHQGIAHLNDLQDSRTQGDTFVNSPFYVMATVAFYVYFFKKLGPALMEKQKPWNVKNAMILYNVLQIIFNTYIVVQAFKNIYRFKNPFCEDITYGSTPEDMSIIHTARCYMYLKLFDIGDTLFFLLRKSYRQISFLHLYHHAAMLLLVWIGFKFYGGGGSGHWIVSINSLVHVVMFTYYLLTSIDERWKSSITFKRTLTQLQLSQFVFFLVVFGRIAFFPTCSLNRPLAFVFSVQNIFMLFLFGDFYVKAYLKPKKLKK